MFGLGGGHLGDRASALVDGQLPPDQEDEAWAHVMHCVECRRAVCSGAARKSAACAPYRGE